MTIENEIPPTGHNHTCFKAGCYFCYEMARLQQDKQEYRLAKRSTYQNRKLKLFKEIFDKFKAA